MRRKIYGQSRVDGCPFCGKQASVSNSQGIPVCTSHRKEELLDLKCACGGWLDVMKGKYGAFFNCMDCGNMNLSKALELNPQVMNSGSKVQDNSEKPTVSNRNNNGAREITVRSDEVDFI